MAAVVVVVLAAIGVGIHRTLLDGLDGLLWSRMLGEDTEFAPGYEEERFKLIHEGMTSQRVLELLGAPMERVPTLQAEEAWRYSRSPSDSHYRLRVVRVARGRVVAVVHEFYVD